MSGMHIQTQQALYHVFCLDFYVPCGRVLLARPRLVLMDESTSALDVGNEAHLYAALRDAGITFVSVGHRPTLTAFHDTVLRLEPAEGAAAGGAGRSRNWRLMPADEAGAAEAEAAAAEAAAALH